MAEVYKLYIGIIAALALCKYSWAEWNSTDESTNRTVSPCHLHGDRDNCTDDTGDWIGHFSRCPEELTFYCVHGECRYIEEQKAPSCRCQGGYFGSRCEYVHLGWHIGDRRHLIIGCTIAVLAFLILLILSICICSNRRFRSWWRIRRRRRRGEEPKKETEKLKMMEASAASAPDATETTHINSV